MFYLLSPKLWIGLALVALLAFTHVFTYRSGAANVRLENAARLAASNQEAVRMERARQRNVDDAARAAATRESRLRSDAAVARRNADSLRDTISAVELHAKESRAAADNAVRALSDVFGSCVRAYQDVAEQADRATSEVKTLRDGWPR
jgi:hypothetical protein